MLSAVRTRVSVRTSLGPGTVAAQNTPETSARRMNTWQFCKLLENARALVGKFGLSEWLTRAPWRMVVVVLTAPLLLASPHTTVGLPTPASTAIPAPVAALAPAPTETPRPVAVAPPTSVPAAPPPTAVSQPAVPTTPPIVATARPIVATVPPIVATVPPVVVATVSTAPVATLSAPSPVPIAETAVPAAGATALPVATSVAASTPAAAEGSIGSTTAATPSPLPGSTTRSTSTPVVAKELPDSTTVLTPVSAAGSPTRVGSPGSSPGATVTPGSADNATPRPYAGGAGGSGLPVNAEPVTLVAATATQFVVLAATGTQTVVSSGTMAPTVVLTATTTATVTVTPTPVPTLAVAVVSIEPATVMNDQPVRIAVFGAGFVNTSYAVRIGDVPLGAVQVESVTTLTGTLPVGLCPGVYPATLLGTAGSEVSGGSIAVQSVRKIVQTDVPQALNVRLAGRGQLLSLALPPIRVDDSGCDTSDWRINLSLGMPTEKQHGKALTTKTVTVRWAVSGTASSYGGTTNVQLTPSDGHDQGTLVLPRLGATSLFLAPSLELEVPASAFAGAYSTTLSASFAD
jgi:hypothetical protein